MNDIGAEYASALFALATEESREEELFLGLQTVSAVMADNPGYADFLASGNISREEKEAALDEAFSGRVHPYLLNFLKLLVERGHVGELRYCFRRFRSRYCVDHGILEAAAVTAVPLREELLAKLARQLSERTGKKVELRNRVDSSVLGGVRLEYEGQALDGTLRQRLVGIEKTLSETVL